MKQIKAAINLSKLQLLKRIRTPKTILLFLYVIISTYNVVKIIKEISINLGYRVSIWIYPIIYTQRYWQIMLGLTTILLLSDAPFIDHTQYYTLIRSGKKVWINSIYLYILRITLILHISVFVFSILFLGSDVFFTWQWGKVLGTISHLHLNILDINKELIYHYTPVTATFITFSLHWLLDTLLGSVMFIGNFIFKKPIGTVIAVILVSSRLFFSGKMTLVSPASLADINMITSSTYSYFFFVTVILLLWIYSVKVFSKQEFDSYI